MLSRFEPVDGGTNRACRGAFAGDSRPSYYQVVWAHTLEDGVRRQGTCDVQDCAQRCAHFQCQGIEFHRAGRCELWTRREGIGRSVWRAGYQCFRNMEAVQVGPRLLNFEPVNGGEGQACRGTSPGDNKASYFTVETADSLEDCAKRCTQHGKCQGIEYHPTGRCEVWTRDGALDIRLSLLEPAIYQAIIP